jgi:hypothetical protein
VPDGVNGNCDIGAYEFQLPPPAIDCSDMAASLPNLIALPLVFLTESVIGVSDPGGTFSINITSVEQSKPVLGFPRCPNAIIRGTTTFERATNQGSGNLLYSIGFKATDHVSGASCTGAVPVCVQTSGNRGKQCTGLPKFDATRCK